MYTQDEMEHVPRNPFRMCIETYIHRMNERIQPPHFVNIVMPGRIIQLDQVESARSSASSTTSPAAPAAAAATEATSDKKISSSSYCGFNKKQMKMVAMESHYLNYETFELHPNMGMNHLPHLYEKSLKLVMQDWGLLDKTGN